jgi:phosphoglycerol transferase MdoB-like AlkP superfamily enzyme
MVDRTAVVKLTLLSIAVWVITLLLYFVGIVGVAMGFQRALSSAASIAVVILIAGEFVIACLAVAFVFIRARRAFGTALRVIWTVVFAVLQFGACAVAVLATLLALNR